MHRITTVIPVYNGEKYLVDTLQSVARQVRRPDRLVILDDQSTDSTREIATGFQGIRCEVVRNPKNLGLFGNHNRALCFAAETEYLHILHSNDMILPDFYARLLPLGEPVQGRALVYGWHEFVDEHGRRAGTPLPAPGQPREVSRKAFLIAQTQLKAIQLHSGLLKTCAQPSPIQFRMDFPQVGDCIFHSQWALSCERIIEMPEVLCQVRVHPDSTTSKNIKSVQAWSLDEWRAMELISGLIEEGPLARWLRRQKLKCLYAARNRVKIQVVQAADPVYAREIARAARSMVSAHHWLLGGLAVTLRNAVLGSKAQTPQLTLRKQTAPPACAPK